MPKSLKALLREDALKKAKEHTAVQGEVIYAANRLHDAFYHTFLIALSLDRSDALLNIQNQFHHHALAIWNVLQSDSAQRDLAITAISTVPSKLNLTPALHRLQWAKGKAQLLWMYRNLMAHTQVLFEVEGKGESLRTTPIFRSFSMRSSHERRLEMAPSLSIWRGLRNDIIYTSEYVEAVNQKICWLDAEARGLGMRAGDGWYPTSAFRHPWPGRPRLTFLTRLQALEKTTAQKEHRPKRRARSRSSRA